MALQCCFPNCTDSRNDVRIYYFPNPVEKRELFEEWVNIIGGELLQMDYETIYENRFICGKHFQNLAMNKVFQKPPRTVKRRKKKKNSANVNNSEPNRQIPNFEVCEIVNPLIQNIKIEPETTLGVDSVNTMENSDSENLPYITHVKSEAVNSASDEDEMLWETLDDNNIEGELITPDRNEIDAINGMRDMYEPLIDIIETEKNYEKNMSCDALDKKTEVSNTIIDEGSEISQINEAIEISEPLINKIKVETSSESEMIWDTGLDENIPNEPAIDEEVETKQINETTVIKEPSNMAIKLENDCEIINNDNQVSKNETPKVIKKVYIPINAVIKHDVERNKKNGLLENGDNERKGFSEKSTPMCITKVTSDKDTFRSTMKTQELPTSQQLSNGKNSCSVEIIKQILNRFVQNVGDPEEFTESLEMANLANFLSLEYENMKEVSFTYEVKNRILKNKIRYLQTQLRESNNKINVMKKSLTNNLQTVNTAYETLTKDMTPEFKKLFYMQMRLSTNSRKTFSTGEKNFALDLFKCSKEAYLFMSQTLILPTLNQIQAWAKNEKVRNNTQSDNIGYDGSTTKKVDLKNNTEAIKPGDVSADVNKTSTAKGEGKTEIENVLVSKGAIEKEIKLAIKTKTGDDIDFEDKLDRDKWVIKKFETTPPQRTDDISNDWTRSELNKTIRSSTQTIATESNDNYIRKGLLPPLQSNDQPDTNCNKYKEAVNRINVYDSDETVSACEGFTDIKENEKDTRVKKQVELASRKLKINLNKTGVRNNNANDLKRAQTITNSVKHLTRKRKSNDNRKISDYSGDAIAAKASKDNGGKRRNSVNEKSRNDSVLSSEISTRHSSRLALKRSHNPHGELKT